VIKDSSYLRLHGLRIIGDENSPMHAIELASDSEYAHHIILQELHIFGFNKSVSRCAIITQSPAWDWTIKLNVIEDVGTGLSLGGNNSSSAFIRGIIEQNAILQTLGHAIFIARQDQRPSVSGVPRKRASTIIRQNVVSKSESSQMNVSGKSIVLLESQPRSGFEENDDYQIYGNFFYENVFRDQALIVASGNVRFHNNILVNRRGDAARFGSPTESLRALDCFNNTVIASQSGITVENTTVGYERRVVGNAVFASTPISNPGGFSDQNLSEGFEAASRYLNDPETFDFYPIANSLQGPAIDLEYYESLLDYNLDFNLEQRSGHTRGAYHDTGRNLGWRVHLGRKNRDVLSNRDSGIRDVDNTDLSLKDAGTLITQDAGFAIQAEAQSESQISEQSCSCQTSGTRNSSMPTALVFILVMIVFRRRHATANIRPTRVRVRKSPPMPRPRE
jgi:hypothetical protein